MTISAGEREHTTNLLLTYQKRLQILEDQRAIYGAIAPSHLDIEIANIRHQIEKIRKRLPSHYEGFIIDRSDLHDALKASIPAELIGLVPEFTDVLLRVIEGTINPKEASTLISQDKRFGLILLSLSGRTITTPGSANISFGAGIQSSTGDISIRDIAGGNIINLSVTTRPQLPPRRLLSQDIALLGALISGIASILIVFLGNRAESVILQFPFVSERFREGILSAATVIIISVVIIIVVAAIVTLASSLLDRVRAGQRPKISAEMREIEKRFFKDIDHDIAEILK